MKKGKLRVIGGRKAKGPDKASGSLAAKGTLRRNLEFTSRFFYFYSPKLCA